MRGLRSIPRLFRVRSRNSRGPRAMLFCAALAFGFCPSATRGSEPVSHRANRRQSVTAEGASGGAASRPKLVRAFVVDDRLSAIRREPDEGSPVLHRLRLAHQVFLVEYKNRGTSTYSRVAISRKTRGWLHKAAVVVPGRAGDDIALLKLIKSTGDPADRMVLCRLMDDHFKNSPVEKQSLLLLGEEADRVAKTLSKRANKRLAGLNTDVLRAGKRDYYANDPRLDRYSRLSVRFTYNEGTAEYVYDGSAYSTVIRRFPDSEEAGIARLRLEKDREKLARR